MVNGHCFRLVAQRRWLQAWSAGKSAVRLGPANNGFWVSNQISAVQPIFFRPNSG
jgi:hypothetical protein